jgi:hypothetical protein
MAAEVDDTTFRIGLLIDGSVVPGGAGTSPVTNPARPAQVVFHAPAVARRLQAGTVFVNTHGLSAIDLEAPMGGWKESGFGIELGPEGMQTFARLRVVITREGTSGGETP